MAWAGRAVEAATASPARLWLTAGTGVVLLVAASLTAGLVLGSDDPAVQADEADAFASAPACSAVPADAVESLLPGAALETSEHGPMTDADSSTCVWTSIGSDDGPPRSLHLDFTAHFTDKAGEVSGARAAAQRLEQLAPIGRLDGADPVPELGEAALVWPATGDGTSAEVAFRRENMLIQVFYGGDENDQGQGLSYEDAREGAIEVAERVAESL
ncbi:hypothetical protein ACFPZ0_19685 [Streptomonospora nanhaiensis]|uniref:DUF3558 domain-containing protein n=1 Tax=Streptomonospora nanhaiensis TaxID=1323731 RepID=A0A853BVQ9_9ACTN|nr:hypothetical protein [Streptomonospora nanhaiensis]MBV2363566.1 hypothetical protein [Streptomonospora nanhaiensis]MBX9390248.1 hypothetical protein [Streptomonospora nanhaiensis]NYI98581.1 hypothetical protein [Streptomonospora nanhaiensis]